MQKNKLAEIAKVESALLLGARKYFQTHGFTEVVVPHLTRATGACENVDTLFAVDYFGQTAYLSQTGQLFLESLIPAIEKVWCVGPSFRAESEADNRHLTEFPLVELEFAGDFEQLLAQIEGVICSMTAEAATALPEEKAAKLNAIRRPFNRITYTRAVEMLADMEVKWGDDLKSRHEQTLMERTGGQPLFITHYPGAIKFFNMRTNPGDPRIVNSADLILPHSGEAVGSAEREFECEPLKKRLENSQMLKRLIERGGSIRDFDWYFDHLRTNGSVLHAGCGIGLNRVTQFVLGSADIRDCTVFPMNSQRLL